jgi:hypothetical protein
MSSWKDKLYDYEQAPPPAAWDKIAAALDESHISDEFPSTLYNAVATPPADAWEKIAGALEPAVAAPVAITRKLSFVRYAAAAAIIGLVAFGIFKVTRSNSSKTGTEIAVTPTNPPKQQDTGSKARQVPSETATVPESRNVEGDNIEITNEQNVSTEIVKARSVKKAKTRYAASNETDAIEASYAYNEHTPNLADRYIMYMTPEGGIVRMSKKWGNLVCCVSGQEQDPGCKDQLKKWQEKLACAPTANGNFMDILSLVNTLNTDL